MRQEQVFDLEAIRAGLDLLQSLGGSLGLFFHEPQNGPLAALEFFELSARPVKASDQALGERTNLVAAVAADEGRGQTRIDHLEGSAHTLHARFEFAGQGLQYRNCRHGHHLRRMPKPGVAAQETGPGAHPRSEPMGSSRSGLKVAAHGRPGARKCQLRNRLSTRGRV